MKEKSETTKKYVTISRIQEEFSVCRNTALRYATEGGAVIRIGRAIRVDREKFIAYLERVNNTDITE